MQLVTEKVVLNKSRSWPQTVTLGAVWNSFGCIFNQIQTVNFSPENFTWMSAVPNTGKDRAESERPWRGGTIQTFTTVGASSDFEGVNFCRWSEGSCRERTRLMITGPMIWCEGDLSEDFGNTLIYLLTVGAVPSFGLLVWSWWSPRVWCSPTPNACSLL